MQGDITNREQLKDALARSDADVVFHVASYGMSGREQVRIIILVHCMASLRYFERFLAEQNGYRGSQRWRNAESD